MGNRMSIVERVSSHHRSRIIINACEGCFYFAEFDNTEQLDFFAQTLGFSYEPRDWYESDRLGLVNVYELSHTLRDGGYFYTRDDLPAGAKPIKAVSNGSLVTCYFATEGDTIKLYRPNPNASAVYHPMTIEQHIAHNAVYGMY